MPANCQKITSAAFGWPSSNERITQSFATQLHNRHQIGQSARTVASISLCYIFYSAHFDIRRLNRMATYKTPGVYVEEISTLPASVAEVSTAIPAFIGYIELGPTPDQNGDVVPVVARINTMLEYRAL